MRNESSIAILGGYLKYSKSGLDPAETIRRIEEMGWTVQTVEFSIQLNNEPADIDIYVALIAIPMSKQEAEAKEPEHPQEAEFYPVEPKDTASTIIFLDRIESLSEQITRRDPDYKGSHSERVAGLAQAVIRQLRQTGTEISTEQEFIIIAAARLHDIGEITMPLDILYKRGVPNELELEIMRRHPDAGAALLIAHGLSSVARIVRSHQEWWNGKGYPNELRDKDIDIGARIIAVCDTYDAITHDRPYRSAQTEDDAVKELLVHQGIQFDPDIVEAFIAAIGANGQMKAVLENAGHFQKIGSNI